MAHFFKKKSAAHGLKNKKQIHPFWTSITEIVHLIDKIVHFGFFNTYLGR